MTIDWITVAAQIANFLVLVWLLRRFLYRPILDGIDAREAEIANRMQDALLAKEKAKAAEQEHLDLVKALNAQKADLSEAVHREAEAQRDALLAEARSRLELDRAAWQAHIDEETRKYTAKLQHVGGAALLSLTRKALTDLADESLEGRIAHQLGTRIALLADELRTAAGQATEAIVSSWGVLPQSAQDDLSNSVHAVFPDVPVRFVSDDEQSAGVILRIGGAQLDWTVDGYIDSLEEVMDSHLAVGTGQKAVS
jgi:F-type H+-transporting ATPase subunit b